MPSFEEQIIADVAPGPDRKLAGATFAAVSRDGVQYNKSFGTTTIEPNTPALTENHVMSLMSATKFITSIAALQCVERGLLDLDADAAELLPQLRGIDVIKGVKEDGSSILEPAREKITLRRLLSHTAGFGYGFLHPPIMQWQVQHGRDPSAPPMHGKRIDEITMPLLFEPGSGWCYGASLDWAGLLIEAASGMTLLEYMQKNIFDPLGLEDFCFGLDKRPDLKDRFVQRTVIGEDGLSTCSLVPVEGSEEFGGGGLIASAKEYFALLCAVFAEDPRLLQKETYDSMYEVHISNPKAPMSVNMLYANYLKTAPMPDDEIVWGHGLAGCIFESDEKDWMRKGTLQWGGAWNHQWKIDRESGIATFVAMQLEPYDHPNAVNISAKFHSEMLQRYGKH